MGAGGLVGRALFNNFESLGLDVRGTTRADLDTCDTEIVKGFPWSDYDVIVDCTGFIDYGETKEIEEKLKKVNMEAPLNLLSQLGETQRYIYLSSHVVLLPPESQNPYAKSKAEFEKLSASGEVKAKVLILRLPGIFADERESGLLYKIKQSFLKRESLSLTINNVLWHAMYLPRVIEIIEKLITISPKERIITVGYPTETNIEKIIGDRKNVILNVNQTDHYCPDVRIQNQYIQITPPMFEEDLEAYFKK